MTAEASTTAAAQAHVADGKQRRRRGWRTFWLFFAGICLLLLLLPCVAYIAWQAYGRHLLQEQVDLIQQRGEPLTTTEMEAWYAVPKEGERDITEIWLAALKPFGEPGYDEANQFVPIVGSSEPIPPVDQPWPDEAIAKDYLERNASELEALHAAAREQGVVRFPRNFKQGTLEVYEDYQLLSEACRALSLQFRYQLRHASLADVVDILHTQRALAQAQQHPATFMDSLLSRAMLATCFNNVQVLAAQVPLTDEQLTDLQIFVRRIDVDSSIFNALIAERSMSYHVFHIDVGIFEKTMLEDTDWNNKEFTKETTRGISAVLRPEDCAMTLAYLSALVELTKVPLREAIDQAEHIIQELALLKDGSRMDRFRYRQTLRVATGATSIFRVQGVAHTNRDITDAMLAARRYELKHGQLPPSLAALVPDYLPTIPIDPFDGQPLRLNLTDGTWRVYSIGFDRVDNGGKLGSYPDNAAEIQAFPTPPPASPDAETSAR